MDRVSAEFHKNVYLLTQFIAPHDDLKKLFKEGMFDKPNTPGFIHVSYYLLNVYYKDNGKNKVQWPVIDKQTENKFRNDVREILMTIAHENADVNFPPIFASHLLLARGTKFILIMWKFSIVVLRKYLTREHQCVLPNSPKAGPCQELTKTFLKNVTNEHHKQISIIRKERESAEQEAQDFLSKKRQKQKDLKAKIFKLREDLKDVTLTAPVNDDARKKLLDIENNEIIVMWNDYIEDSLKSIEKDNQNLEKQDQFLKSISNTVLNLSGNSLTLNALNFDRINVDPIYKLVPPEEQVCVYHLYNQESLNLHNFFSIFNLMLMILQKSRSNIEKNDLDEFSKCITQLQTSNKDLKTAANHFQNLHEQIVNFLNETKKKHEKSNENNTTLSLPEYDKVLFMPSPSIHLNNHNEGGRDSYLNNLKLTPVEGAHKQLFSKHAFKNEKGVFSVKRKLLPVQSINFDDTTMFDISINNKTTISQQQFPTPSKLKTSIKNVTKYSRIFSQRRPDDNTVNNSMMLMMSSTRNSMLPFMTKQHCISLMDSCNSSQEFSQEPLLLNPSLNSTIEPSKQEGIEKIPQKSSKRRSIGDLVERYKKILQKGDTSSHETNIPAKETLDEETNV